MFVCEAAKWIKCLTKCPRFIKFHSFRMKPLSPVSLLKNVELDDPIFQFNKLILIETIISTIVDRSKNRRERFSRSCASLCRR